jgi:alpha-1,3-mannosyltransferase
VVRQFHPGVGGLESFVASLAESLAPLGHDADIITLNHLFVAPHVKLAQSERVRGVLVQRVAKLGGRRVFVPVIPRPMLARYDVLHVHGIDGMFERIGRERLRPMQVRIATSHGAFFHTPWMKTLKQVYFDSVTRLAARGYDALIANSKSDLELLHRLDRDVSLIANGVAALGDFQATGRDLLYLGRLASHKHTDRLIDALAEPALSQSVLHLVGPEWDVTSRDLRHRAIARGVENRVCVHGHVSAERLREIARGCGVFVSASSYEGFGMSMIEGMSVGLIPVAEANASFAELLSATPVGTLTAFENPSRAAKAIRDELDCLSASRRTEAQRFAAQFGWAEHAKQTDLLYRRLLEQKRTTRYKLRPARV